MKKFLRKKVLGVPVLAVAIFFMAVTVALGAWLLQTRFKESVLGVKAKHLLISEDGVTFTGDLTGVLVGADMPSETGGVVEKSFYLKSSKAPLAGLDWKIENLQRFDGFGVEVAKPVDPALDIANYFFVYDVNVLYGGAGRQDAGLIRDLAVEEGGVAYTGTWFSSIADPKVTDEMGLMLHFQNTLVEDYPELNGAYITFDLVIEETPAP